MLCCCGYADIVVANFPHIIQSEYYGSNQYVSIEGIKLDRFSATTQTEVAATSQERTRHSVFCTFLNGDIKQDASTTVAHIKRIIALLKQCKIVSAKLGKIWENTDGCVEHYICGTVLYLMSMLLQAFSVIIDHGISAPGHGR